MKCKWCERPLDEDDMIFVDRKYRHYPERIWGWIHKDCRKELTLLDNFMISKNPKSEIAKIIIKKWKRIKNNEIRQRWGDKIV